jgi:hypothetical protein
VLSKAEKNLRTALSDDILASADFEINGDDITIAQNIGSALVTLMD